MTKKIVLLKSTSNKYLEKFMRYVESHYEYDEMAEKSIWCVGNKIGQFLGNKSEVLIIHEPTQAILKILADIDLVTSEIDFELYRISLGEDCPDNFDFMINETEFDRSVEEQIDFILNSFVEV